VLQFECRGYVSPPDLFSADGAAMIGQTIQIGGASFEIIGVLSEKGGGQSW
jgi:hypothetical protein